MHRPHVPLDGRTVLNLGSGRKIFPAWFLYFDLRVVK